MIIFSRSREVSEVPREAAMTAGPFYTQHLLLSPLIDGEAPLMLEKITMIASDYTYVPGTKCFLHSNSFNSPQNPELNTTISNL